MSYDLLVFVPRMASGTELGALVVERGGLEVERSDAGGVTVVRGARRRHSFTVDGPDEVDDEDVPEDVAAVVLGVRYQYSISVDGTVTTEIPHAVRFARRLARALDGAVLDEQSGEMWSRSRTRVVKRPHPTARVATIGARWYCLRDYMPADPARVFIAAAQRYFPEALPRRFGEWEPLQGRYSVAGVDGFAAAWAAAGMTLYFDASLPCLMGSLDAGPSGDGWERFWHGSLSILADPIAQPGWHSALRRLFTHLADVLSAFYASAEMLRGDGNELATAPLRYPQGWLGLPPQPTWWSWFGPPYREIADRLPADGITATANGVLYEAAAQPTPADALRPLNQFLPANLFATPAPNPHRELLIPLRRATEIPASLA